MRWAALDGTLLPTAEEVAEVERDRAEVERERSERLSAKLRALGIDPEA